MNKKTTLMNNKIFFSIIASINKARNSKEYDLSPIQIDLLWPSLITCLYNYDLELNPVIAQILQSVSIKTIICLRSLFGFCESDKCSDCKLIGDDYWSAWKLNVKIINIKKKHPSQISCKYDIYCTNNSCGFRHNQKKLCQISCPSGSSCANNLCPLSHPIESCPYGVKCEIQHCPFHQYKQHLSKKMHSQPHSSKNTNIQPHSSKNIQPQPHSSKNTNIQPHSSKNTNIQPHDLEKIQPQTYSSKNTNIQPHSSKNMSYSTTLIKKYTTSNILIKKYEYSTTLIKKYSRTNSKYWPKCTNDFCEYAHLKLHK